MTYGCASAQPATSQEVKNMTRLIRDRGDIQPATGKMGILCPGMGAVATTFIAGVEAVRRDIAAPIGSLTQMGHIRLGKRTESRSPLIREFVPLQGIADIVFGGWDVIADDAETAARKAGVLDSRLVDELAPFLSQIKPMRAAFDQNFVKLLKGDNVIPGGRRDWANQLRADIRQFKADNDLD
jgi:myo-inositol-1-phosphate synthase